MGSTLFNIVKNSNYFKYLLFTRVHVRNVLARVEVPIFPGTLLMDTKVSTNPYLNVMVVLFTNVTVEDANFENGKGLLELIG
jgi:hypothetical protein